MSHPTAHLSEEHRWIKRALACLQTACGKLERGETVAADFPAQVVDFIQGYTDRWHHAKEEDLLFPLIETRGIPRHGGPLGCMMEEHDQGRRYAREMQACVEGGSVIEDATLKRRFVDAARGFIALLPQHIDKEDRILYPMADNVLSAGDQADLRRGFEEAEERLGKDRGPRYLAMVEAWEAQFAAGGR